MDKPAPPPVVLVIDYSFDWSPIFKPLSGKVSLEQTSWEDVDFSVHGGVLHATCAPSRHPFPFTNQGKERKVKPACVLIRNFPMELRGRDFRNQVMALVVSGVPCVNNATSILATLDRAWLYGELLSVERSLGSDVFPVIPLSYLPNTKGSGKGEPWSGEKVVVKVGSTNAGFGKAVVESEREHCDLWSILACQTEYVTEEPFVAHEFEYRVQFIAGHIRCFKRTSDTWKNNTGNVAFADMAMEPKHEVWCAACAKLFGGIEIFSFDDTFIRYL